MSAFRGAEPDRRFAAHIVEMLYSESDQPAALPKSIVSGAAANRKNGSSRPNYLTRSIVGFKHAWAKIEREGPTNAPPPATTAWCGHFFKGECRSWGEAWGNPGYMVTKPGHHQAMVRVCADLAEDTDSENRAGSLARTPVTRGPSRSGHFDNEGFTSASPAKGQWNVGLPNPAGSVPPGRHPAARTEMKRPSLKFKV